MKLFHGSNVDIKHIDLDQCNRFNLLIEFLTAKITGFLMQDNEGMTMSEAILLLHNSDWFDKASNPETLLYIQSPLYNYELLKHELKYGTLE